MRKCENHGHTCKDKKSHALSNGDVIRLTANYPEHDELRRCHYEIAYLEDGINIDESELASTYKEAQEIFDRACSEWPKTHAAEETDDSVNSTEPSTISEARRNCPRLEDVAARVTRMATGTGSPEIRSRPRLEEVAARVARPAKAANVDQGQSAAIGAEPLIAEGVVTPVAEPPVTVEEPPDGIISRAASAVTSDTKSTAKNEDTEETAAEKLPPEVTAAPSATPAEPAVEANLEASTIQVAPEKEIAAAEGVKPPVEENVGDKEEKAEASAKEQSASMGGETPKGMEPAITTLVDRLRAAGIGKAVTARIDSDAAKSDVDMDYDNWVFTLDRANNHARDKAQTYRDAGGYVGAAARVRIQENKVYALDRTELLAAIKAGVSEIMVQWEDVDPLNAMIRSCQIHGGLAMGNKEKDRAIKKILTSPTTEVHGTTSWLQRPPGWLAAEIGIPQATITACAKRSNLKFSDCLTARDGRKLKGDEAASKGALPPPPPSEVVPDGDPITYWARVRWPELPPEDFVKVTEQPMINRATGKRFGIVEYDRTVTGSAGRVIDADDGTKRTMTGDGYSLKFNPKAGSVHVRAEVDLPAGEKAAPDAGVTP